jgi:Raf kinase inhibitor-like YbhB/YbcL family protein
LLLNYAILWGFEARGEELKKITVSSAAFEERGMIPKQYTCDGANVSPPLAWDSVSESAKSLVVISDDPDAPAGTWVHWVMYNLPPDIRELPEKIPTNRTLKNGARQGTNDFGNIGYGGPCPPSGTHRYYFKLYALDTVLDCDPGMSKAQIDRAMKGHVLASGQLMGTYKR